MLMTPTEMLALAADAERLEAEIVQTYGEKPFRELAKINKRLTAALREAVSEIERLRTNRPTDETIERLFPSEEPPCREHE